MAETKKIEEGITGDFDFYRSLMENVASGDDDFFRQLFNCLREGIWVIDGNGCTLYLNPSMADILGYTVGEMLGKTIYDFISGDSKERLSIIFYRKNAEKAKEYELVFTHKDGREVLTSIKTASFSNTDGKDNGIIATVTAISRDNLSDSASGKELELNRILSELYIPLTDHNTSIEKISSLILEQGLALTGSLYGYVSEIDTSSGQNVAHTLINMMKDGCELKGTNQRIAFSPGPDGKFPGLYGYSLNTGESFYTNNPGAHPSTKGVPEGHIPIERFLSVAVEYGNNVIGQIALANPARDYTDLDLHAITRLGRYYGWALQQYRAQKKLADSEELLRQVFDASLVLIYVKDNRGKTLLANKATCEVYGVRQEDIIGKSVLEMAELGMMKQIEAVIMERDEKEVLAKKEPILIPEESFTLKDGKVRWFRTIKIPFRYLDEMCIMGISMEITQIREQEEELGRQLERYDDLKKVIEDKDMKIYETYYQLNQIFNSSPVGMCLIDKEYNVSMANETYCKLTNQDLKDILGSKCYQIFRSDDCFSENCACRRILRGGKMIENQIVWERSDETAIPCYVMSKPFFDFQSELIGIIHTYQDISQIIKTQEELKNKELLFYQSQKMEAIGRLAGGIAHDFNNLLTIIRGYTEMLLGSSRQDSVLNESLNEILKASTSAASLIGQLLAFGRKQILDFKVLDLNMVLRHMQKMLQRVVTDNIEVSIQADPSIPSIKADKSQLEQIMMNLVVNAHDALPDGGKISISTGTARFDNRIIPTAPQPVTGDFVFMAIEDNGIGMAQETVERIFEPFFTTKRVGEGTGLGLPTVFGIVKQHDGYIHVISELGKGSRFEIYFPAVAGTESPSVEEESPGVERTMWGRGELVLVLEDEEALSGFARRVLEMNNYRVLTTGSIAEAKEIYQQNKEEISLVFTDLVLKDGFGMEYILYLKNIDPDLKIIATSGYVEKQLDGNFFNEQDIPFLTKPYEITLFLDTIHRLLHN